MEPFVPQKTEISCFVGRKIAGIIIKCHGRTNSAFDTKVTLKLSHLVQPSYKFRTIESITMIYRKIDLARKFGISPERLDPYEKAGVLHPIAGGDYVAYANGLTVAVIAKAEKLGFTVAEIVDLIKQGTELPNEL